MLKMNNVRLTFRLLTEPEEHIVNEVIRVICGFFTVSYRKRKVEKHCTNISILESSNNSDFMVELQL